jgi:hypothetical protein
MEHHPLDKACIGADKAVADLLASLPAARIAEVIEARGPDSDDPEPSPAEALAYLDEHEPGSDGPLARAYATLTEAQAVQRAAHIAWRDFLANCQDA